MGKITVIKTSAFPKLIYPLSGLSNPPMNVLTEINSLIFKFIWNNKPEKIKRNRLKMPIIECGWSFPDDFNRAIKAGWIKRYLDKNYNGNWKIILNQKLIKLHVGNTLILETNLTEKDIKTIFKMIPSLWKL